MNHDKEPINIKYVRVEDRSGHCLGHIDWDGYKLPGYLKDGLRGRHLQDYVNDQDYSSCKVLICSYPRSGFHWMFEIVNMMMNKTLLVSDTNGRDVSIENAAIRRSHHLTSELCILHTHLTPDMVPIRLRNTKTIHIYRNPKDVAYSFYKIASQMYYGGAFEDYLQLFLEGNVPFGSWFDYILKWEKQCQEQNMCVVSYEDMCKEPFKTLRHIADYLELDVDENFLMAVNKACHIANMKGKTEDMDGVEGVIELARKGVAGGWKDHYTVAQSEQFDRVFAAKMKTSKLEFKFEN